jgi:hypothetical protein
LIIFPMAQTGPRRTFRALKRMPIRRRQVSLDLSGHALRQHLRHSDLFFFYRPEPAAIA